MRGLKRAAALIFVLAASGTARAGWEIDQKNYNLRASGQEVGRTTSRLLVSKDRVRLSDGRMITLFDYKNDRLALLLPSKKIYWQGTSDEYLRAVRGVNRKARFGAGEMEKAPKFAVKIEAKPETVEIAGKVAKKYSIQVDGYPFQDLWVADSFGIEKDLDVERFQAMQLKLAQSVRSNYAVALTALQKDPVYLQISRAGYPMRINSYLGEAIMGSEVVRVVPREVPESEFAVPKDYRVATLPQLMDAQVAEIDAEAAAKRQTPAPAAKKPAPKKKPAN